MCWNGSNTGEETVFVYLLSSYIINSVGDGLSGCQ